MTKSLPLFLLIKQHQRLGSSSLLNTGRLEAKEVLLCCSDSIVSYLSGHKNISELSQWHFNLLQGDEGSERFPWHWKYLYLEMLLKMENTPSSLSYSCDRKELGWAQQWSWNLIPANNHGKWETEPEFFVSQNKSGNKSSGWILSSWQIEKPKWAR